MNKNNNSNESLEVHELTQQPAQLEIFQNGSSDITSHTFRAFDRFLSFIFGRSNRKRESGKYLPAAQGKVLVGEHEISVLMTPARIVTKTEDKDFYPGIRELSMLDGIVKSSASDKDTRFYNIDGLGELLTLSTTHYKIREVFREFTGAEVFSHADSVKSIEILSRTHIEFSIEGRKQSGSLIGLGVSSDDGSMKLMLHPLLSKMVKLGAFRQINFIDQVAMKKLLSRFMHRLLVDRFTYASKNENKTYNIMLSGVRDDYPTLEEAGDLRKQNKKMKDSLDELKRMNVISKYEIEPVKEKVDGRLRIVDYKYTIWATAKFAEEQIVANRHQKDALKKTSILTPIIPKREDYDSQHEYHEALVSAGKNREKGKQAISNKALSPDEVISLLFELEK